MEKLKTWIADHKGIFATTVGLALAVVYYLYRRFSASNTSAATSTGDAGSAVYSPGSGGTTGGGTTGGGGSGGVDTSAITEMIKTQGEAATEQQKTFMVDTSAITEMIKTQGEAATEQQKTFMNALADTITGFTSNIAAAFSSQSDVIARFTNRLNTSSALQPNVPTPAYVPTAPPAGGTVIQPNTGGGTGGTVYNPPKVVQLGRDTIENLGLVNTAAMVATGKFEDRMINNSRYTVPVGLRSDWKPGQAYIL